MAVKVTEILKTLVCGRGGKLRGGRSGKEGKEEEEEEEGVVEGRRGGGDGPFRASRA